VQKLRLPQVFRGFMHAEWIGSLLDQLGVRTLLFSAIGSGAVMLWDALTGGGGKIVTALLSFAAIYVFLGRRPFADVDVVQLRRTFIRIAT